jgi:hypothetical protein
MCAWKSAGSFLNAARGRIMTFMRTPMPFRLASQNTRFAILSGLLALGGTSGCEPMANDFDFDREEVPVFDQIRRRPH